MFTHYDRLQLPVNATSEQIKSQYRRLAKTCHPDLNPDNPRAASDFNELHTAYLTLSDPEKRQLYDSSLSVFTWKKKTPPRNDDYTYYYRASSHSSPATPKTKTPHQGPRRPMFKPEKPRSEYMQYTVNLSIRELFTGARCKIPTGQTHSCPRCRGKGVLGTGEKCQRCGGFTFLVSYEFTELVVPPGILPGTMIRVEIGHSNIPDPMFDVLYIDEILVTIQVKTGEPFTVKEQHLYTTLTVPEQLMEEGGNWKLQSPEGSDLVVNIPAGVENGTVLTLRKQGLKNGASHRRGNLYCTLMAG